MKDKALTVKFQNWGELKEKIPKVFKEQKRSTTPKDVVVFSSVTEYQKFMTEQKLAILAVVANKRPQSIYQPKARAKELIERFNEYLEKLKKCESS